MNRCLQVAATALLSLVMKSVVAQGPPQQYFDYVKQADSLYNAKAYQQSADKYSQAFKANSWKGLANDRYNAACCWALAGNADSAFFQLERIAVKMNYSNYNHIIKDPDLTSLYKDSRWEPLILTVRKNKELLEINYIHPLVEQLDTIYQEDQGSRMQLNKVSETYGWESKEIKDLWKEIGFKDSINLIKVMAILDEYGWLGPDRVGQTGATTLFLVIQHSDQATQEKYLPMMREAVAKGNAFGSQLALLEDRVALGQGKKQTYGSQIGQNNETKTYYLQPLEDPDNVDKRRESVGLGPLAEYISIWGLTWDVEQYKKDLPAIEEMERKQRSK